MISQIALAKSNVHIIECHKPFSSLKDFKSIEIIEMCPNVKEIVKQYEKYEVGIGFAGEFVTNVASSFGHTFIIFIDPENHLLSPTISYLANTNSEVGGFSYIFKGIFGGYNGEFKNLPFYKLEHVYTGIENRDLWIYKFKEHTISKERLLFYFLEIEQEKLRPYFFINYNCTSAIREILNNSTTTPLPRVSRLLDYPASLIYDFANKITLYKYFENRVSKMHRLKGNIKGDEIKNIEAAFRENKPLKEDLSSEANAYLNSLYDYFSFKVDTVAKHKKLVNQLPLVGSQQNETIRLEPKYNPVRVVLGSGIFENIFFNTLTFRPSYKEKSTDPYNGNNRSSLELFKLSFLQSKSKILLNEITLFSIENNMSFEWPTYSLSSRIDLKYERFCALDCKNLENVKLNISKGVSFFSDNFFSTFQIGPSLINVFATESTRVTMHLYNEIGLILDKYQFIINSNYFTSTGSFNEFKINPYLLLISENSTWSLNYLHHNINDSQINSGYIEYSVSFY